MTPDFIAKAPIQEIVSERSMTSANAEQFVSSYSESNLEFMFPIFINNLITSLEKKAEIPEVLSLLKSQLEKKEFKMKWAEKFGSLFTESELMLLASYHKSDAHKKMMKNIDCFSSYFVECSSLIETILRDFPNQPKEEEIQVHSSFSVLTVTNENFEKEVLNSDIPVVIKAFGKTCPPCKVLAPIFSELGAEMSGKIKFVQFDAQKETEISKKFNISALPTLIFVKNGKTVKKVTGLVQKETILMDMLQSFAN